MSHIASKLILFLAIAPALSSHAMAQQTNTTLTLRGPVGHAPWLVLSNAPATAFCVEVSQDLRSWQPLISVTTRITTLSVADSDNRNDSNRSRFYRTKAPGVSVDEQAATWAAVGPSRYRYHFRRICFCRPAILSGTVIVQDGTVIGVTNAVDEQNGQPIPNPELSEFKSLEQLFAVIRQAKSQNADTITIKYDPILRFPARVELDFLVLAADDEIRYEARDVEPID